MAGAGDAYSGNVSAATPSHPVDDGDDGDVSSRLPEENRSSQSRDLPRPVAPPPVNQFAQFLRGPEQDLNSAKSLTDAAGASVGSETPHHGSQVVRPGPLEGLNSGKGLTDVLNIEHGSLPGWGEHRGS